MAWDSSKPRPKGNLTLPPVTPGMNKVGVMSKDAKSGDKTDPWLGSKDEEDDKLLEEARKRLELCIKREAGNRKQAIEARKFKLGQQWPSDVAAQRNTDKRPCITVNKMKTFINQVVNDQRQNRPTITFSPIGDKGDREAAKMFKGMTRAIERDCAADIAYDTAFDDAVTSGWGYWRYLTEYEDEDSFHQVIVVKQVRNPFTIYLDPYHQEPDGSDLTYAFATERIPRDEFEERFPDAQPVSFLDGGPGEKYKDWIGKDDIRVAEYWKYVTEKRTLVKLDNGHEGWEDELSAGVKAQIKLKPDMVLEEREAECRKVMMYMINGVEVLQETEWLGKWIPIVKVIGNQVDIEGESFLQGLIADAMDAQRMHNYWSTMLTEVVALMPKNPTIGEEGQFEGHEQEWNLAHTKPMPYVTYKGVSLNGKPIPPPQRQPPAGVPAGIQQALQNTAMDMIATTGIRFDATNQERMNDESGVAIRELRRTTDLGSLHYVDNLSRSLRHGGRILVDLIPKIYDEKRRVTILHADDREELVQIDPHQDKPFAEVQQGPDKPPLKTFNPKLGKYGVAVTIGPSFATKRIEAAESMMEFAKAMPQAGHLIADLIAKEMDWEGSQEIAARLARAQPPNLLEPDQKDMSPQVQALISSLKGQLQQQHQLLLGAQKELADKDKDRAIAQSKIDHDFEAKVLAIIQKAEEGGGHLQLEKVRTAVDIAKHIDGGEREDRNNANQHQDATAR